MKHTRIRVALLVTITALNLKVRAEKTTTSNDVKEERALGDAEALQLFAWFDYASVLLLSFGIGFIVFVVLANRAMQKRLSQKELDALKQMPRKRRTRTSLGYLKQHARPWYIPMLFCAAGLLITALAFPILQIIDVMRVLSM